MVIERLNVLGVGVSELNLGLATDAMCSALDTRTKGYICVTGVHGVMEAQQDPVFRTVLNRAFLVTPDGMPLVWWGKLTGHRTMDRVYGPDLMLEVLRISAANQYRHFLYAGTNGVTRELSGR